MKVYLRDRLTRSLSEFPQTPWYLFVMEDLDASGENQVRPHAHGMIEVPRVSLDSITDGRSRKPFERLRDKTDLLTAEIAAGRKHLRKVLRRASGHTRRANVFNGIDQRPNVWTRESYNPLFNHEAISYAFKNADAPTSALPDNRLATSQALRTEARRLWELVRSGEAAMDQWAS
ncbi:hypothetical protein ACOYW6_07245 [Parablastomonas sp. CN1-191]|uniref:hypothetical protein n=1 Tax=Parablastomonas sp. CN1-191 TaxID=3400908 RepID=UPI003BF81C0D